jgi:hypothetical protein
MCCAVKLLRSSVAAAALFAVPIPSLNVPPAPTYIGAPARPAPIRGVAPAPHNRFMAANGVSEIHDNGWQSDTYAWSGPLGRGPQTFSNYLAPASDCGSITFDRRGRVVSICIGLGGPKLYLFNPRTLATLATFALPPRAPTVNLFQNFSAGGYFYLNNRDQVVTGTTTRHIYVIGETATGFALVHDYSLTGVLGPDEQITSQLPDSRGLLWFTARQGGVVGTLNFKTGAVHVIMVGGEITKSLATDTHGGVYIATNRKLYRFVAGQPDDAAAAHSGEAGRRARELATGRPRISWQVRYPNTGVAKPGQLDAGTGTTPVISGPYVGINDNADPMDVMIYRTSDGRAVCREPVFSKGSSADENAMIAAGRSYIIENNYGYQTPLSVQRGRLTAPGFARVEINRDGRGCHLAWTNTSVSAPTVVSKLSLADGLIYTYTTTTASSSPWYWTALSFRTGRVVFKVLAGNGVGYNNNYSGISISPGGTAYLGTLGGIIALRDGG